MDFKKIRDLAENITILCGESEANPCEVNFTLMKVYLSGCSISKISLEDMSLGFKLSLMEYEQLIKLDSTIPIRSVLK